MDSARIFYYKTLINQLLKERPNLRPLQERIDKTLRGATSQHNRCVIIQELMLESSHLLAEKMQELSHDTTNVIKKIDSLIESNELTTQTTPSTFKDGGLDEN